MVAKGIVTFGLGGDASTMLLGRFNLGFGFVDVIVKPKKERGGRGVYGTGTAVPAKDWRKREKELYDVIFVISYKDSHWTNKFTVEKQGLSSVTSVVALLKKVYTLADLISFKISLISININKMYVKLLKAKLNTVDVVLKDNENDIS